MDSIKKNLGSRIRQIRKAAKLSAEELAEKTSVHPNSIYTLERGENWVSPELLERICGVLGVAPSVLFEDDSIPIPSPGIPRDLLEMLIRANDDELRYIRDMFHAHAKENGQVIEADLSETKQKKR